MKYNIKITNKETNKTTFAFHSAVNETEIQAYLFRNDTEENQGTYSFEIIEVDLSHG